MKRAESHVIDRRMAFRRRGKRKLRSGIIPFYSVEGLRILFQIVGRAYEGLFMKRYRLT